MTQSDVLNRYRAFLLDIDGVLVRGGEPISGAAEAVEALQARGQCLLLSNNSSRSRVGVAERLEGLGFTFEPEAIVPSSYVVARWLLETEGTSPVWTIGEDGLRVELELAGHRIVSPDEAEWLVIGICWDFNYAMLAEALAFLLNGGRYIATNTDATFPTPEGPKPGAGAVVGAIQGMGFQPHAVIGKPSPIAYRIALEQINAAKEAVLTIGDRLETDILGARDSGIDSALVLTGISSKEDVERQGIHPTWIAEDLLALARGELHRP